MTDQAPAIKVRMLAKLRRQPGIKATELAWCGRTCGTRSRLQVARSMPNIAVDSERYHRNWTGELCLRDQLRSERLIELGWEVKRFWVPEVRDSLNECVASIVRRVQTSGNTKESA